MAVNTLKNIIIGPAKRPVLFCSKQNKIISKHTNIQGTLYSTVSGNQQLMQISGISLRQEEQRTGIYIFTKKEHLKIPVGIG